MECITGKLVPTKNTKSPQPKSTEAMLLVVASPTQDSTSVRYLHLCADLPMLCRPLAKKASRTSPAVHSARHLGHASCDCQVADAEPDSVDGAGAVDGYDFGLGNAGGGSPDAAGAAEGFLRMLTEAIDGWSLPDHPG